MRGNLFFTHWKPLSAGNLVDCFSSLNTARLLLIKLGSVLGDASCSFTLTGSFLHFESGLSAPNINPNLYVFNSLMNVNACYLSYTMNIYKHMQNLGVVPDIASYNILLKSCCLAARLDTTQEIYREVEDLESKGSLKLDVFTYSTMIKITNRNLTQESSQVVPMKVPFKPTTATYNVLMKACGTDHFLAKALMEEMETVGLSPNHISWSTLIGVYGGSGDLKNAVQVLKTMCESDVPPDVIAYSAAIKAIELGVFIMCRDEEISYTTKYGEEYNFSRYGLVSFPVSTKHYLVVDTIIKLLQDNLGLEVLSLGPKIPTDIRINVENPFNPHPDLDKTLERSSFTEVEGDKKILVPLARKKV
ncbi:Pentatricopeptide repeat-containing protein [Artemisia annua]|uniref:Pentatricopeptide repeat-containing protein n=1 Tax=Artemisia annua TaxID=35608 RepID=A0A2U1MHN0_ARTAN|nr:Pentatricopeptide repeat-containing protein [Artemisia annua]